MSILLITLGIILIIWFLYSWLSVRAIEEPKYKVISTSKEYEIRMYDTYIIAETTISGAKDRNEAVQKGFPIVAGYIFGGNTSKDKVSMTVPVNTEMTTSKKIAMTTPVNTEQEENDGTYKISFVMPSEYTLDTLPTPNDNQIIIKEIPSHAMAVKQFTWPASESRIKKQEELFLSAIDRDNIDTVGVINVARYNPPWTIPFMLRNEVQIKIK